MHVRHYHQANHHMCNLDADLCVCDWRLFSAIPLTKTRNRNRRTPLLKQNARDWLLSSLECMRDYFNAPCSSIFDGCSLVSMRIGTIRSCVFGRYLIEMLVLSWVLLKAMLCVYRKSNLAFVQQQKAIMSMLWSNISPINVPMEIVRMEFYLHFLID